MMATSDMSADFAAIAIAQDMFLRLRRNVGWKQDWHLTTVVGVFSATAACGRVLGLSKEQMVNAFGIAGTQSSGALEFAYGVGCALRGMYAGFTSKAAVLSALMAEKGVTGPAGVFRQRRDDSLSRIERYLTRVKAAPPARAYTPRSNRYGRA